MTAVEQVIARLEGQDLHPKGVGAGKWEARCPAHDDRKASLSIGVGADDRVLLHCHAECPLEDVLAALDLTPSDLFASNGNGAQAAVEYIYVDAQGATVMKVVRRPGKKFAQARPDGKGGWIWNLRGVEPVLFELPKVLAAVKAGETIYIAEGEKDVLALGRAGVTATTNPAGAGKWRPEFSKALAGANVVVIADADQAGRKHGEAVAASLRAEDCTVRIVEAVKGKDASDHLAAGLRVEDFAEGTEGQASVASSTNAATIPARRIRWAWRGRLPLGYLALWSGESSLGKTLMACWMISAITRGRLEGHLQGIPSKVLIIANEDARDDMWVPRLMVAEADLHYVEFQDQPMDWSVRDGTALTRDAIERTDAKLVFVDSVLEVMPEPKGGESLSSPMFVRRSLRPLAELLRERQVAGLVSTHPPKAKGSTFADMVISSAAFVHVTRVGMLFAWHPADLELPDQERRRVLMRPPGGSNIGRDPGTYEFTVRAKELLIEGETEEIPYIDDLQPSDVTYRDLTRTQKEEGAPGTTKLAEARSLIEQRLADGQWHPSMIDELIEQGFTKSTAYRAAEPTAKLQSAANGWYWAKAGTPKSTFVEVDGKAGTALGARTYTPGHGNRPPNPPTNRSTETSSQPPADFDETTPSHQRGGSSHFPTPTRAHASNGHIDLDHAEQLMTDYAEEATG